MAEGKVYVCSVCGWEYTVENGAPIKGVKAGTEWKDVPKDFKCPVCSAPKSKFKEKE
ncbi:MAG: rubredoxin [Eubacteriales bacterium]|jgi:rubredoxin-NAD+ reductase|nr:rubredoxin [Eubacteriales bacterium]